MCTQLVTFPHGEELSQVPFTHSVLALTPGAALLVTALSGWCWWCVFFLEIVVCVLWDEADES